MHGANACLSGGVFYKRVQFENPNNTVQTTGLSTSHNSDSQEIQSETSDASYTAS
jgi:hypothetical protein